MTHYDKVRQVLQSVTHCYGKVDQVLQNVTYCYDKMRQVLRNVTHYDKVRRNTCDMLQISHYYKNSYKNVEKPWTIFSR